MRRLIYPALAALAVVVLAIAVVVVAVASYNVTRKARGEDPARPVVAQPAPGTPAAQPTPIATTPSGLPLHPDTRRPFWADPYREEDRRKPRFDQTINGIRVGPTAGSSYGSVCVGGTAELPLPLSAAAGTPLMITPTYLPPGSGDIRTEVLRCKNTNGEAVIAAARFSFWVPPIVDHAAPRFGGGVDIVRWRGEPVVQLDIPAERISAGSIKGRPAVIARPILPNGIGDSAIILYEDGVVTLVELRGSGIPLGEMLRIAEGLY